MADRSAIAKQFMDAQSSGSAAQIEALAAVLEEDAAFISPLGNVDGRAAIVDRLKNPPQGMGRADQITWSDPAVEGGTVKTQATTALGTLVRTFTFSDDDMIAKIETQLTAADTATRPPSDEVLRWAASAVDGTSVVSTESLGKGSHRASGTFRLRIEGPAAQATDVILKVPVPGWISPGMVSTNARALRLADTHGLPAPRLIAADLKGTASGTVATLETFLPGSNDLPPTVSVARLQEAGATLARINALEMEPQAGLPRRTLPHFDDTAAERRKGLIPTTPLLQEADERVMAHRAPAGASVFLHGDVWAGNMLWEGDRCVALIDWKTAGVGHPSVDLCGLRVQVAIQYGQDAPAHVLEGWQRQAGKEATAVAYWDAVAALNEATEVPDGSGFADDGSPLDAEALTERRDAFLRNALDQLPARND